VAIAYICNESDTEAKSSVLESDLLSKFTSAKIQDMRRPPCWNELNGKTRNGLAASLTQILKMRSRHKFCRY